jgi:hypothetical protein
MYDLKKDPNELNSVYGQPEYAALTKELKNELNRLRKLYKVPVDDRPLTKAPRTPRKSNKEKKKS